MNDIKRGKVNIGRENITGNVGDLTRNNIEGDLANTNCQNRGIPHIFCENNCEILRLITQNDVHSANFLRVNIW